MKIFFDSNANQINIADERFYESKSNPGTYFPSVTTILDIFPKGYGYTEWLKQVGFNADEIMKKAAEQGSNVHGMIDNYLKGFPVTWLNSDEVMLYTLDEWKMFCRFIEFWEKQKPEILVNEFSIVSDKLGYGGTIDFVGRLNGQIWLIDWKTSNMIHKTNELQLSAYCTAWNELNPQFKIEKTGILWLKALTRGESNGKIQGAGWQLKEFDRSYSDGFQIFKHTQAIWNEENPNYRPKNETYPVQFQMK